MHSNPFEEINDRLSRIEQELIRQRTNPAPSSAQTSESPFLTVAQAADFLNLAPQTIYGLISRKQIPCFKRQKRVYFSKETLTNWLQSGRLKTTEEIEAESHPILVKKGGTK